MQLTSSKIGDRREGTLHPLNTSKVAAVTTVTIQMVLVMITIAAVALVVVAAAGVVACNLTLEYSLVLKEITGLGSQGPTVI